MATTFHLGDVLSVLQGLPDKSVHCCVTSPPYWGLRDYSVSGQLGQEPTPDEYVEKLVTVFRELRRVLRDDGTLWLNLGDSYAGSNKGIMADGTIAAGPKQSTNKGTVTGHLQKAGVPTQMKPKDMVGIPWAVAFALRSDGWYLRSDCVWHKPNALPESVQDRPVKDHEYVFLLSKSSRYYYDREAIKEPIAQSSIKRMSQPTFDQQKGGPKDTQTGHRSARKTLENLKASGSLTRCKRTVWSIPTKPYKGAHFAVMPEALVEPCILAGSPEKTCPQCGAPLKRVLERITPKAEPLRKGDWELQAQEMGITGSDNTNGRLRVGLRKKTSEEISPVYATVGWAPTCECDGNSGSGKGVVIDPFGGSGTVAAVAKRLGRDSIYIDLNPNYLELARQRVGDPDGNP